MSLRMIRTDQSIPMPLLVDADARVNNETHRT